MDVSKILTVICAFALIVCLALCITTLVVLRNAVAENGTVQENASVLVEELNNCVDELNHTLEKNDSIEVSADPEANTDDHDGFCLREVNGNIGIYTADGYLIKVLDVAVSTLPPAAREDLIGGITVKSWQELMSLIQDYTA